MIGLDTNVIVRHIVKDDLAQAHAARQLLATLTSDAPGFISLIVLAELWWVLSRRYKLDRTQFAVVIDGLLLSSNITVERSELARNAFRTCQTTNADFADCLIGHCAAEAGCRKIFTFDITAVKSAGMTLLLQEPQ